MKKCTYCGKEVSDDVAVCPLDGEPVVDQAARPEPKTSTTGWMIKGSIHAAAQDGDLERVKALLKDKPDLISSKSSWNPCGTTLHYAASNGRKDVVELLLANKADVNAKDDDGKTPLHSASENGHKEVAELLLASKANVNARNKNGATPLLLATKNSYKEVADLLLANVADSTLKTYSRGPIRLVLIVVTIVIAFMFLHDFGWKGDFGGIIIIIIGAIFAGWEMTGLFSRQTLLDQPDRKLLLDAIHEGRTDSVLELLENNRAEVNDKDEKGETPLHWAVFFSRKDVAELLLTKGANVNAKANDGVAPLHWAAAKGYKDVAELLLANKADVNAKANTGWIPLHSAAYHGHKDVTELLLANNADADAKTNDGNTPLQLAMVKKHKDVAELLRKHAGHE